MRDFMRRRKNWGSRFSTSFLAVLRAMLSCWMLASCDCPTARGRQMLDFQVDRGPNLVLNIRMGV